jgi:hypothetical protein
MCGLGPSAEQAERLRRSGSHWSPPLCSYTWDAVRSDGPGVSSSATALSADIIRRLDGCLSGKSKSHSNESVILTARALPKSLQFIASTNPPRPLCRANSADDGFMIGRGKIRSSRIWSYQSLPSQTRHGVFLSHDYMRSSASRTRIGTHYIECHQYSCTLVLGNNSTLLNLLSCD